MMPFLMLNSQSGELVIKIGDGIPTDECIEANAKASDYAWLAQTNNMVPIVEPEVLMDGDHTITECFDACARSFLHYSMHYKKSS